MDHDNVVVSDTQSYSIQFLNFAKKWFIQYSIQYCFAQDSIQNIGTRHPPYHDHLSDGLRKKARYVEDHCDRGIQNGS